jgi:hypothetical protein
MSINFKKIINLLKKYTDESNEPLEIIILGGLAMEYYGMKNRKTVDLDAEINGNIENLIGFFKKNKIPADIGEDISRWGTISMPPNYREKTITVYEDDKLKVKVLQPAYYVISKMRRGTNTDWSDIKYMIKKYKIKKSELKKLAEEAIRNSPKDTAIFIFKKQIEYMLKNF